MGYCSWSCLVRYVSLNGQWHTNNPPKEAAVVPVPCKLTASAVSPPPDFIGAKASSSARRSSGGHAAVEFRISATGAGWRATTAAGMRRPPLNLVLVQIEPIRFQFIAMHRDVRIDGHVYWRARVLPAGSGGRRLSWPAGALEFGGGLVFEFGVALGDLYVAARSPSNGPGHLTTLPRRGPPGRSQQCRFSFSSWHQAAHPCANSVH